MIVKIQRPLASTDPNPQALVYNRGRGFQRFMPMTPEIEALFTNGELKVYHVAKQKGAKLLIGERVPAQDF